MTTKAKYKTTPRTSIATIRKVVEVGEIDLRRGGDRPFFGAVGDMIDNEINISDNGEGTFEVSLPDGGSYRVEVTYKEAK